MKKILVLALALQACALAGTVTYTYTGNPFTNCQVGDCSSLTRVTATLEFADPLAPSTSYTWGPTGQPGVALSPLVWLMSNGQDTVAPLFTDPVGANSSVIFLITDSIGQIATWVVQGADPAYGGPSVKLTTSTGNSLTIYDDDATSLGESGVAYSYIGFIDHTPGTWQMTASAVPEPGTVGLLVLGALALVIMRARLCTASPSAEI